MFPRRSSRDDTDAAYQLMMLETDRVQLPYRTLIISIIAFAATILSFALSSNDVTIALSAKQRGVVWGHCGEHANSLWCDTSRSAADRAAALVRELAADEKATLLSSKALAVPRLGLPQYNWWNEALHGLARAGIATQYPQVIGLSSSFNASLWHKIGRAIGMEARGRNNGLDGELYHGLTLWAPNVNIFRDPRWGRGQETAGEDPMLSGVWAVNFVRGVQGAAESHHDGASSSPLLASAALKHFVAYDRETYGGTAERMSSIANVNERDMQDTYLAPFRDGIEEGRASGLMCSYNAETYGYGGSDKGKGRPIPSCANKYLLTDLARGVYGFDGYVTTDCGAATGLGPGYHKWSATLNDTIVDLLSAGVDTSCGYPYTDPILGSADPTAPLLKSNKHVAKLADVALTRLLTIQMRLGFFDAKSPSHHVRGPYGSIGLEAVDTNAHRQLAREAAEQSIVLLANKANALPLSASSVRRIALIGPLADDGQNQLGNYFGTPPYLSSVLDGLNSYRGKAIKVSHHEDSDDIEGASELASQDEIDAVVLVVGTVSEAGAGRTQVEQGDGSKVKPMDEAEGLDRTSLLLHGNQSNLVRAVAAAAASAAKPRPVVLVLMSGGSLDVSEFDDIHSNVHAILWAGYPGQAGGEALASILFGDVSPSGRLTTTWHKEDFVKAVPFERMEMRPTSLPATSEAVIPSHPGLTHRFYNGGVGAPLYPFGHGLSYLQLKESIVKVVTRPAEMPTATAKWSDSKTLRRAIVATVTVKLEHLGGPSGAATVLLFARPPAGIAGVDGAPLQSLVAFERVPHVAAGNKHHELQLEVSAYSLSFADADGTRVLPRGVWSLYSGSPWGRAHVHDMVL